MAIYVDGDFDNDVVLPTDQTCYTSTYSSTNVAYKQIALPAARQKQINQESFDNVVYFYNKFEDYFQQFLKDTGVDVWFFEHFRLYFTLRKYELKLEAIRQFLKEHPQGSIYTSDPKLKEEFPAVAITYFASIPKPKANKKRLLKEFAFILKKFKFRPKQNSEHVILSRIEDDRSGKDQRFGSLEEQYDKLYNREAFNLSNSLVIIEKNYHSGNNIDQIMARYFVGVSWLFHVQKFRKAFTILKGQVEEQGSNFNPLDKTIWSLFLSNKSSYLVYYLRYKAFKKFFKSTNYKSMLFINENSAQQRAIQHAAADEGVAIMAYQHGAIYDLHPAYMYGKYAQKPLLPTITFTWGDYFTALLIEQGGYAKNAVVTSGRIPDVHLKQTAHPELSKTKALIVYATQPQPDQNLRQRELIDVLTAVKAYHSKYQLVLRPHPAEKTDEFFNNCAKEAGYTDFLIDRVSDLKNHFEKSSLLITSYSTVGAEYIPYYKPLLVLDYLKADLVNYIKQGVGIPIYNGASLIEQLNTEIEINKTAYDLFVANYFYANGEEAEEIVTKEMQSLNLSNR